MSVFKKIKLIFVMCFVFLIPNVEASSQFCGDEPELIQPIDLNGESHYWAIKCDCQCTMENHTRVLFQWAGKDSDFEALLMGEFSRMYTLPTKTNNVNDVNVRIRLPNNLLDDNGDQIPPYYIYKDFELTYKNKFFSPNKNIKGEDFEIISSMIQPIKKTGLDSKDVEDLKLATVSHIEKSLKKKYEYALSLYRKKDTAYGKVAEDFITLKPWKYAEISPENVGIYNDFGFFLEQSSKYKKAIELLEIITAKYPSRVVAHLNLADAYFGVGDSLKAKQSYTTYIQIMMERGKQTKIPARAFSRGEVDK